MSLLKPIVLFSILFAFILGCNSSGSGDSTSGLSFDYSPPAQTYEEKKLSLEETERQNPLNFLETSGTYRTNLIGEFVINGTISSTATAATYKDISIQVSYYTKTKTLIANEIITIYDFVKPGRTIKFKKKLPSYSSTETLGWEVISAR